MDEKICAVVDCTEVGTVEIKVIKDGEQKEVVICQKCWEHLNFGRNTLEFKKTEKL